MDCQRINQLLSEYVDGVLPSEISAEIDQHLAGCDSCREAVESTKKLIAHLSRMEPVAEPADFVSRVNERMNRRFSLAGWWRRMFVPLRFKLPIEAAALALIALLIVRLWDTGGRQTADELYQALPGDKRVAAPEVPAAGKSDADFEILTNDETIPVAGERPAAGQEEEAVKVAVDEGVVGEALREKSAGLTNLQAPPKASDEKSATSDVSGAASKPAESATRAKKGPEKTARPVEAEETDQPQPQPQSRQEKTAPARGKKSAADQSARPTGAEQQAVPEQTAEPVVHLQNTAAAKEKAALRAPAGREKSPLFGKQSAFHLMDGEALECVSLLPAPPIEQPISKIDSLIQSLGGTMLKQAVSTNAGAPDTLFIDIPLTKYPDLIRELGRLGQVQESASPQPGNTLGSVRIRIELLKPGR